MGKSSPIANWTYQGKEKCAKKLVKREKPVYTAHREAEAIK